MACVALLVVVGAAALVLRSTDDEPTKFCSGIGLAATESSQSPEIAFSRWLATRPDLPPLDQWKRAGADRSIANSPESAAFENRERDGGYAGGLAVVILVQGGRNGTTGNRFPADEWSVDGACLGYPL